MNGEKLMIEGVIWFLKRELICWSLD